MSLSGEIRRVEIAFLPAAGAAYDASSTDGSRGSVAGSLGRDGSWLRLPPTAAASLTMPARVIDQVSPANAPQVIEMPARSLSGGAVHTISIAPDSPMHAVDLIIGNQRHRVSVGNPLVMDFSEYDQLICVPTRTLPDLGRLQTAFSADDDSRFIAYFDFQAVPGVATSETGKITQVAFVARLNLYRGTAQPNGHQQRGPYSGQMVFDTIVADGAVAGDAPQLFLCTEGRRCVDVLVALGSEPAGTHTVDVFGIDAAPGCAHGIQLTQLITAMAVTVAAPLALRYEGTPFLAFMVRINSVGGTSTATGCAQINAWDSSGHA